MGDSDEISNARAYLRRLTEDARLSPRTEHWLRAGHFLDRLPEAPRADLHLLGLPREVDAGFMQEIVRRTGSSCLFVRDSGRESALA